jgi:hypothetical protein
MRHPRILTPEKIKRRAIEMLKQSKFKKLAKRREANAKIKDNIFIK